MKFENIIISLMGALLFIGVSTPLSAAPAGQFWWDAPWRFNVKGYGWLPTAPATIDVDQEEVANIPETLDNILDSVEVTAMFELEAHKGPLGFFVSPIYYKGHYTEHFTGELGQRRKFSMKETVWLIDYGVSYELGTWHLGETTVTVKPFVGGLYFHDPIKIDVDPGQLDIGLDIDKTIDLTRLLSA